MSDEIVFESMEDDDDDDCCIHGVGFDERCFACEDDDDEFEDVDVE